MSSDGKRAEAAALAGLADGAMRYGPRWGGEEARIAALESALRAQYDLAIEEAAQEFDGMAGLDGETTPIEPKHVAKLLRDMLNNMGAAGVPPRAEPWA